MSRSEHIPEAQRAPLVVYFVQRRKNRQWTWSFCGAFHDYGIAIRRLRWLCVRDPDWDYRVTTDQAAPDDAELCGKW